MRNPRVFLLIAGAAVLSLSAIAGTAQRTNQRNPDADWPMYNRDLAGTRFSPLTQINTSNVAKLTVWSYKLRPHDGRPLTGLSASEHFQEITPIVVDGIMYLPAGQSSRGARAGNRKEIWVYELKQGQASFRGVSYWPGDRNNPPRIFFTTARKLAAINALTGEPSTGFGNNGEIDLKIPYDGAPAIYKNTILMGSNFTVPVSAISVLNWIRARASGAIRTLTMPARATVLGISHDAGRRRTRCRNLGLRELEESYGQ